MNSTILDRSARVIAVESSGAARQLLTEVIKAAGFQNVQGMASLQDLLTFLETDQCDWIIVPLNAESTGIHVLSLMHLFTTSPELRSIRVNLLVEAEAQKFLPKAFELGLLGWHAKPFTKVSFEESFQEFLATVEKHNGQEDLIAADYLRPVLRETEAYEDWIKLEQNILNLHPGEADLLLNLAEPLYLSGQGSRSAAILRQAKLLDPDIAPKADALLKEYSDSGNTESEEVPEQGINVLGIDNVVIVDSDETIQKALCDILRENGVSNIQSFADGESAAKYIKENPNPGLIIHEWRLPKLSGPLFVQRILNDGATASPIILLSSLIQAADMPLLKEIGIATVVDKPFDRNDFLKSMIWTLQEDRLPTDQGIAEMKIRKLLRAKRTDEAQQIIGKFLSDHSIPPSRKKLIEAEWAYHNRDYELARDAGLAALKGAGESINTLNLLGKTFMQLRDFESGLKCLQKAQALSPKNIERLCQIAESQCELGAVTAAEDTLEEAKDLDPESSQVSEASVKLAMHKGDTKTARKMMDEMEHLDNLVAYMNNKAVALARCDKFDDSVEQYHRAIASLPENRHKLKSLVYYNLALALARAGELEDALRYTELALRHPNQKIKAKAGSLHNRLTQAIKTGADFQLVSSNAEAAAKQKTGEEAKGSPAADPAPSVARASILSSIAVEPGEVGCFLIYVPQSKLVGSELIKTVKFGRRASIEREETMKGESAIHKAS